MTDQQFLETDAAGRFAFIEKGQGQPILLVHGFASTAQVNWQGPGWLDFLAANGFRAIAMDNLGHGGSTKSYDPASYELSKMSDTLVELIGSFGIDTVHIMGYSMGARISASFASRNPERVEKLILAGNGYNMIEGGMDTQGISSALLADELGESHTAVGRQFRVFAEKTGGDLKALAACMSGDWQTMPKSVVSSISCPTLVIAGTEDEIAKDCQKLADLLPNGTYEEIPKRNHMNAVGDKIYKEKVLRFLTGT